MKKIGNVTGVFLLVSILLAPLAEPLPAYASGTIRYASPSGMNSGSCSTWGTACNLPRAIAVAVSGNQVWVKQGIYKPGSTRSSAFTLKDGVAIYGGFAGSETKLSQRNPVTHVTILSGEIGGSSKGDNSFHVVIGGSTDNTAILDGFTITAGHANGSVSPNNAGGGLYVSFGSPTLRNITVSGNFGDYGGGIYTNVGSPQLNNVTFSGNSAYPYGGGMYNGNGNPTLTSVTFAGNNGGNSGGGIFNNAGSPTLMGVTFSGNKADFGGGMANNTNASPTLTNVTFNKNSAVVGGGMFNIGNSNPVMGNVTFSGNSASSTGKGMENEVNSNPYIHDSIFWNDGTEEIHNSSSTSIIADSIVKGSCPSGAVCSNVYNINPKLGPLQNNGGYTKTMALGAGSPAIDFGNTSTCAAVDQRGVTRPQGEGCDMGAYEVRVMTFTSVAAYDGWVLESAAGSNTGGSLNSTADTLRVGDDFSNGRYHSVLSFNTSPLPDGALVALALVRVREQSTAGNPFGTEGTLLADLVKPYFGSSINLVKTDWQAAATVHPAGSFSPDGLTYLTSLNSAGRTNVNKTGTTQVLLRFSSEVYNGWADYLSVYSGSATTPSDRPHLIVYYNP